jgi:hypothetical protein
MNEQKPEQSLKAMEAEVLAEGREWTRQRLQQRLQAQSFGAKDIIGALRFAASEQFPPDNHTAFGERHFLTNLTHHVPLVASREGRRDEFRANIALAEVFFCGIRH